MIDSGPADFPRHLWDRDSDKAARAAIMHYGTRRRALLAGAWDLPTYAQDVIPYLSRAEAAEAGSKE